MYTIITWTLMAQYKNLKYIISLICFLLFFIGTAYASDSISFQFKNNTSRTVMVFLYWIDHDWDYPGPVNLAGGEMKAGQVWTIQHGYKPGKYVIIWKSMDSKIIKVTHPKQTSGLVVDVVTEEEK